MTVKYHLRGNNAVFNLKLKAEVKDKVTVEN